MSSAEVQARIAELRKASFAGSRRGFDRDEVQRYLAEVADWLEGLGLGDSDRGELRRELAWVGERTSEILSKAEETASEIEERAAASTAETVAQAEAEAERTRAEADDESRRTRLEANTRAEEVVAAAEHRADELLAQAAQRRGDLQTLIGDLLDRRDEIVADGNRLADELAELFAGVEDEPAPETGEERIDEDEEDEETRSLAPDTEEQASSPEPR